MRGRLPAEALRSGALPQDAGARASAPPRKRGADERQALLAGLLAQLERGARAAPEERPRLLAEFNGHLHVIDATQVELIEADRNYVVIRVGRDSYHARSTLSQAEQALRSQPMLRISRSCLVNINYLREVNRTLRGDFILVLAGGATVTSSEGFRSKVKEYLGTLRIPAFGPERSQQLLGCERREQLQHISAACAWFPVPCARSVRLPARRSTTPRGRAHRATAGSCRPR